MKSPDTFPISPAFLEAHRRPQRRTWFDRDDEPTTEVYLLEALVTEPAAIVDETEPIAVAQRLFVDCRVPAIAVVDAARTLRGIVTRTDVLRVVGSRSDALVGDAMSGFIFSLPADATVERAAALMALEGVGQIVVTDRDGQLVGMVSALDITRHFAVRAGYLVA
jgi:CBS domain-containing protein